MTTSWKAQQDLKTGRYYLQFETDDKEKYKQLEKLCQELVDKKNYTSTDWIKLGQEILDNYSFIPESCRACSNHPSNGGSGFCNCTLGHFKVT